MYRTLEKKQGGGIHMSKPFDFRQDETEKIIHRFGKSFYEQVQEDLDTYAVRWDLSSYQLIPSYSANLVFTCSSRQYGEAVLKIAPPASKEFQYEYQALREFHGRRFCQVFEADPENGVILMEQVRPGVPLRDEPSLDRRLSVFCSLYRGLHVAPEHPERYPTYLGWVRRITEYMGTRADCKELYGYMKKAEEICLSLSAVYTRKMLLHGDLHHDNLLLGRNGGYVVIDPKGVVGDPIFDVPRFILNEFGDDITEALYRHINHVIHVLGKELDIPEKVLRQCLFVETAMGVCWSVEDGAPPEEYPKLLKYAAFAESILNGERLN